MGVSSVVLRDGPNESPEIAVDNLQVLAAPTCGPISAIKLTEKQLVMRRKGTEKSVLDDIMGDPDDFRDLGESDAESDWGRWEDNVRNDGEDGVVLEEALQQENLDQQDVLDKDLEPLRSTDDPQPSLPVLDMRIEPSITENQGVEQSCSERQHHASDKESVCLQNGGTSNGSSKHKVRQKRYFIIKSLNHHNIAKSIENGIWATQAMNEPVLNEAFESAEKVLLIFSVNMSGHFQGYAQMVSPIGQRRASVWNETNSGANPWGGTFHVEWIRMYDLPFQKTVHLRNPLNSFKPVKISRDCQELTQDIGEALCALIDEGADRECKSKRKISPADASLGKKPRTERPSLSNSGFYRPVVGATPINGPATPFIYSATQFSTAAAHEPYNSQMPIVRSSANSPCATSGVNKQPRSSRSRSPRSVSSGKGAGRDRDRKREGGEMVTSGREKELSRHGGERRNAEAPPEEDFLNMTYEEYLQHHGNPKERNQYYQRGSSATSHQSTTAYGAGWTSNSSHGTTYSDDQYANYLANWYGNQQGAMIRNGGYYAARALANPYPSSRPP